MNEPFPCAICGALAVKRVKGNCKLLDGTVIRGLSRFHCDKCGENFFDRAAMKEIRRQRQQKGGNNQDNVVSRQRKSEPRIPLAQMVKRLKNAGKLK